MSRVLPILFNSDMVRAILDGRKTVTRRIIKGNIVGILNSPYHEEHLEVSDKILIKKLCKAPYQPGDILYVRETYCPNYFDFVTQYGSRHGYKADYDKAVLSSDITEPKWTPSIHMPKEAARIWLKVTDVRAERLRDITNEQILGEGANKATINHLIKQMPEETEEYIRTAYLTEWSWLWDSTIKKSDLAIYGWDANPWVWVIEFERCEKPEC